VAGLGKILGSKNNADGFFRQQIKTAPLQTQAGFFHSGFQSIEAQVHW
jgi:hypothetical protein